MTRVAPRSNRAVYAFFDRFTHQSTFPFVRSTRLPSHRSFRHIPSSIVSRIDLQRRPYSSFVEAIFGNGQKYPAFFDRYQPELPITPASEASFRLVQRPMADCVQILSEPTADTGPCLLLTYQGRRYLFGHVPEGTSRVMAEQKISLRNVEQIFLSGVLNWGTMGGLIGTSLSLADVTGAPRLDTEEGAEAGSASEAGEFHIHGGWELSRTLAVARNFFYRRAMSLKLHSIQPGQDPRLADPKSSKPDWQDPDVRVWYLPLMPRTHPNAVKLAREPDHPARQTKMIWDERLGNSVRPVDNYDSDEIIELIVKDMFGPGHLLPMWRRRNRKSFDDPSMLYVEDKNGHMRNFDPNLDNQNVMVFKEDRSPAKDLLVLPPPMPAQLAAKQSMCYIVKTFDRRGKFDPKAAKALGVEVAQFKALTNRESVTTKAGNVVEPSMVLGPDKPGHGFAVVTVEDESYIESFVQRPEWDNPEITSHIEAIYWLRSDKVQKDPAIQAFKERFSGLRHIMLDEATSPNHIAMQSSASQLAQLARIDPERFKEAHFDNTPRLSIESASGSNVYRGVPGGSLTLHPRCEFVDNRVVPLWNSQGAMQEIEENTGLLSLIDEAKTKSQDRDRLDKLNHADEDYLIRGVETISLGTGSSNPGKYRNVSGTLLRVPGYGSWLLDVGENTIGQLRRICGHAETDLILADLRGIYISHAHADHHLGLISMIQAWREVNHPDWKQGILTDQRLAIVAGQEILRFLSEYSEFVDISFETLVALDTTPPKPKRYMSPDEANSYWPFYYRTCDGLQLELPEIQLCLVDHCRNATAVTFTWHDIGLRVSYSGDCRPSEAFAIMGRGSHLLIHEATLEDEMRNDAIAKKHSTFSEALTIAHKMQARRLLLTHFSQRYARVPSFMPSAASAYAGAARPVLFAFDGMRVCLGAFREAELFLPAIRKLFNDRDDARQALADRNRLKQEEEDRNAATKREAARAAKREASRAYAADLKEARKRAKTTRAPGPSSQLDMYGPSE